MTINATTDAILNPNTFERVVGSVTVTDKVKWDISLDADGDIATQDFFDTSLLMSLFAEKRANAAEVPTTHLQRGWIGNESFDDEFEIGSKIWLYEQARLDIDTLNSIKSAARDGLQWYVDRDLLVGFTVSGIIINNGIDLNIELERENSVVERRFFRLWENSGVTENVGN